MTEGTEYDFDVAVSFAGEDRAYVTDVVSAVKRDLKVFYDEDYLADTWGEDLVEFFTTLYRSRTRYVVIFISAHYAEKEWTRLERRAALARAITQRAAYVLPIRLDDTELDGLLPTVGYLDARRLGLHKIADAIRAKTARPDDVVSLAPLPTIPISAEDVQRLVQERPALWEYRLFAGLMTSNMAHLESAYADYAISFARPSGLLIDRSQLVAFCSNQLSRVATITQNLEVVLDHHVQQRAFGKPGEPGDPDRITHLAGRLVSVYEDMMSWSADLRAASTSPINDIKVLRLLARWTEQPIEACRQFVANYTRQIAELPPLDEIEGPVNLTLELTFEISPELIQQYHDALEETMF